GRVGHRRNIITGREPPNHQVGGLSHVNHHTTNTPPNAGLARHPTENAAPTTPAAVVHHTTRHPK
ncbi:hypothetical protein, partial [Pseudarthrobacter raffinosi]|uniref:hypothetical protein n=1 Tax=Pseudarthrobacter raffinosi TaxID=2953651 RepID=UPI00208EA378